jgi:hypothetical protein
LRCQTGRTKFGFRPSRPSERTAPNEAKLADELAVPTDARIYAIARALYSGLSVEWVASHSRVDKCAAPCRAANRASPSGRSPTVARVRTP